MGNFSYKIMGLLDSLFGNSKEKERQAELERQRIAAEARKAQQREEEQERLARARARIMTIEPFVFRVNLLKFPTLCDGLILYKLILFNY